MKKSKHSKKPFRSGSSSAASSGRSEGRMSDRAGGRSFGKSTGRPSFGKRPRGESQGEGRAESRMGGRDTGSDRPRRFVRRDDERAGEGEGRRSFGDKKFGDKKFGDRPFKKKWVERDGDAPRAEGRRSFGDKKFGDKKFGDKPFKKKWVERDGDAPRAEGRRSFGDKKFGDKKFGDKPFKKKWDDSKGRDEGYRGKGEVPSSFRKSAKPFDKKKSWSDKKPVRESTGRETTARIESTGQTLFGFHAVRAAWLNPKREGLKLYVSQTGLTNFEPVLEEADKAGLKRPDPQIVDVKQLDKLTGGHALHQGLVLEYKPLPEVTLDDVLAQEPAPKCILLLDQITDPHNVGAILRSACAFGVGAVLMTDRHAASATGTLAKTASGALEYTPLVRVPNLAQALARLQQESFWCIGLAEEGKVSLHDIKMPEKVALVLGAEGEGLRRLTRESCDELARLPTQPPVGSLNVSNAAAVALYEVIRQR